jgi:AcrR family transcriptional regulator
MYEALILECAERVFASDGYHAAKMQSIAAEAGISPNTLYGVFQGKREIFEAIHESRGTEFLARIEAVLATAPPALEALRGVVSAYVSFVLERRDYFRMDLFEGRSWAIGDVESNSAFQTGMRLWTELMRRGIEEGEFEDDDTRLMATTALGLMQVQLAYLLEHETAPDVERLSARIGRQLERALRRDGGRASSDHLTRSGHG